jgi:membrane protein DedA with SNARE-associated domain
MKWLIEAIRENGSLSVFIGGIIEEIVVPIPSPLVSMAGGAFLVEKGEVAIISLIKKVVLPFSLGATLGSSFVYLLAFFGGRFLIDRVQRYLGFDWQMVEKTRKRFIKGYRDELAIFLLRAVPVVPVSLISGVCGAVRLDWKEFSLFTFFGLLVRSFILGFLGWQLGIAYEPVAHGIDKVENLIFLLIVLSGLGILGFLYYKREKFFKRLKES